MKGLKSVLMGVMVVASVFAASDTQAQRRHHRGGHYQDVERIQVNFNDMRLQSQSVIGLRRVIRNKYPHIKLNQYELQAVKVVAKTKFGQGHVRLIVGGASTYPENLAGSPYTFQSPAPYTFDRVRLYNPAYDSTGRWQLQFRGNTVLRKAVVTLRKKTVHRRPRNDRRIVFRF